MNNKLHIQEAKLLCRADAQKNFATLKGSWTVKTFNEIFGDYFSWTISSKCKRVLLYPWHSNTIRAEMGQYRATGRTAKSAIRHLRQRVMIDLDQIGAKLINPFPKF